MAQYTPPTEILPIFDSSVFDIIDKDVITTTTLLTGFLPVNMTTGTETFTDVSLSNLAGMASVNNTVVGSNNVTCGTLTIDDQTVNINNILASYPYTTDMTTASYIDLTANPGFTNSVLIKQVHNFSDVTGISSLGSTSIMSNAIINPALGTFKINDTLTTSCIEALNGSGFVALNGTGTANIPNLIAVPVVVGSATITVGQYPRCVARAYFYWDNTLGQVIMGGQTNVFTPIARAATGVYNVVFLTPQTVSTNYEVFTNINYVGVIQPYAVINNILSTGFKINIFSANNTIVPTDPTNGCQFTVQYYP